MSDLKKEKHEKKVVKKKLNKKERKSPKHGEIYMKTKQTNKKTESLATTFPLLLLLLLFRYLLPLTWTCKEKIIIIFVYYFIQINDTYCIITIVSVVSLFLAILLRLLSSSVHL